jgi:hypothetical protein
MVRAIRLRRHSGAPSQPAEAGPPGEPEISNLSLIAKIGTAVTAPLRAQLGKKP